MEQLTVNNTETSLKEIVLVVRWKGGEKQSCIVQHTHTAEVRGRQVRHVPGSGKGETVVATGRSNAFLLV